MQEKLSPETLEQLAQLLMQAEDHAHELTAAEYTQLINHLAEARYYAQKKENKERARREKEEAQRKAEEEKRRQEQHVADVTCMDLPMDWDNLFERDERTQGVHADSISDGLILSLSNLGRVDIEYIAAVTGEEYKTVIGTLKGSIYQNPEKWNECFYQGWETAEEYLSGNLMRKWHAAQKANKEYKGYFEENIRALSRALPELVNPQDIYITLGSPWVPADIIDDFVTHLLGLNKAHPYKGTRHDEHTGTWELPDKSAYWYSVASTSTYGTNRIAALYILEKTLNMKAVAVTDEVSCPANASGKKRVVNREETVLALEKQQKMIQEFQNWVWKDDRRRERLEMIFENNFSCFRRRHFDGSFLNFPTLSPAVQLYPYQKNAVARILFTPNTLLAHDVGSGKTYIMIAAGMELKRMGLSKKNLYVVPNNIVGQWRDIFKMMYPKAKLLVVEPKNFTPAKRQGVLEEMRDGDYDGIVMAYSCFERIPLSKQYEMEQMQRELEEIDTLLQDKNKSTGRLKKKKQKLEESLSKLLLMIDHTLNEVCFDELGVTRLFVDEAHNYKNVPIETKADKVLGINATGSKKCQEMMDKVQQVQRSGGGVVMATGTPITNSITDAFIMQKYLQSGELGLLDLQSFDSWIGMFAERATEFEIDVDTSNYRLVTRFSKFHNLPELTALLSSIADFHQAGAESGIPQFDGYSDAVVAKTPGFAAYLSDISHRADLVRRGVVNRREDNMLKITTDGRKAALDLRLVEPNATFTYQSKVARCAENVFDIYLKTYDSQSTQLIFCDTSTPKSGFNMYDDLRDLLVSMGMPEEKIAFVHDATTEVKRTKLFAKMRSGEVRVLIGSTFKLGLGVNVQDKLIAVHHLDVPWRPADMTQREGRILRQGNQNSKVSIYRYITEGSFDAYSWQLLETKQRFITGLLSGSLTQRSGGDIDNTVLDYAEVKALAVGNPLIKKRVETANELTRYLHLQRKAVENRQRLEKEIAQLPGQIHHQAELVTLCRLDKARYETLRQEYDQNQRREIRAALYEGVQRHVLMQREDVWMTYQGFEVVFPPNMTAETPYVWLRGNGQYYVELGDTEVGGLIRLDNFLDNLEGHLTKLEEGLQALENRQAQVAQELSKREDYRKTIEGIRCDLERIDKKLGVNKA
ncbi:MAG: hypothetical protein E7527_06605 [Ruminococcaceae bacterium]|nr:hypothetical protein [Oscillospiraceae bacterium]